jgi:hypothetical protein
MTRKKVNEVPRIPRAFHLEAERLGDGKMLVILGGVKGIVRYGTENLSFDIGESELSLVGSEILCRTFSSGVVEVRGKLSSIVFFTNGMKEEKADGNS